MAFTWEFYLAMVLFFIAIVIIIVFVYLLFWPQGNIFDRLKNRIMGRKSSGVVVKGKSVSARRGGGAVTQEKGGSAIKSKGNFRMFKKKSVASEQGRVNIVGG